MTGKELIMYILLNSLENKPISCIFSHVIGRNGDIKMMTIEEYAEYRGVGLSTVTTWLQLNTIQSVQIANRLFIPVWRDNDEQ